MESSPNVFMTLLFLLIVGAVVYVMLRINSPDTADKITDVAKSVGIAILAGVGMLWDKISSLFGG